MNKILVVEDDPFFNRSVCTYLSHQGYEVTACLSASDAFDAYYKNIYDLIISDIMMPQIDGFEFVSAIREMNQNIPILFISAREDFNSKQKGYSIGIDDYMVKPIDLNELLLRIEALLRRAKINSSKKLIIGQTVLDREEHCAYVNGEEITLTVREFDLLYKLLSYPKKTFTRNQLMDEFWDVNSSSTSRVVDVYMTKLRDKFKFCSDFEISTVHGLGYKAVLHEGLKQQK